MPARTALIVEDEKELAELLCAILRLRHFEPAILYSGGPATDWVRQHHPSLILLDLMLPERDGYSICQELKLDKETNLTPVIMVTARTRREDRVHGLAVGANEYLTKPFTVEQLNDAIDRALAWESDLRNAGARGEVHFEFKSDTRHLEELNDMLSSLFLHSGITEHHARQLTTAVREMGVNAIEWGHRHNQDLLVTVKYRIEPDKVVITIQDAGPGFDRSDLPHAAHADDPVGHMEIRDQKGLRPGGFGIMITRGLVDEMNYNDRGNEVTLVKYVSRDRAEV